MPISNKIYPRTGDIQTVYLKNVITNPNIMLMCDKVAHKNLIDDSPLFRKTYDIITCPTLCFCFQID